MPTAFDLIGHNAALQEHWIRRLIAAVIDGILLAIVLFIFNFALSVFLWGFLLWPLLAGVVWWLYSIVFEGTIGATIGKKLVSLQVVAVDGLMDLPRAMIRNVTK